MRGQDALRKQLAALEQQLLGEQERSRALEALLRSRDEETTGGPGVRYRELVEHSQDTLAVYSPAGVREYISPSVHRQISKVPEDLLGRNVLDDVLPEDRPTLSTALEFAAAGEPVTVTCRFPHPADGRMVHVELAMRPMFEDDGTVRHVAASGRDVTQRILAQSELDRVHAEMLRQAELMAEAQRIAGVGSYWADLATGEVKWSPEMHRIFGLEQDHAVDRNTYLSFLPEPDVRRINRLVVEAARSGQEFETEHALTRPDGQSRVVQARVKVTADAAGAPAVVEGTVQDVTDQRSQERELRAGQATFAELMKATTEQTIIGADAYGTLNIWNSGAEQMLGYTAEEMLGQNRTPDIHAPEDVPRLLRVLRSLGLPVPGHDLATEADLSPYWTYVRKNGSRLTVQLKLSPMIDEAGTTTGVVGVAIDVTDRLRAQRELAERAQMLRAVIEQNQSVIVIKDLGGRYLLANQAYEKAYGHTEAEVLGTTDGDRRPAEETERLHGNLLRAVHGTYQVEEEVELADGRHVFESVKVPLFDADGAVYAVCSLSLDVTQRRQAEQDSREAMLAMGDARDRALAANAAKSAFLATMSHEIRTPMNAVIGLTDLVLESGLTPQQQDLLGTVRSSGEHLLAIINDVLDFTKVEAGELDLQSRPFDVRDLTEQTLAQFSPSSDGLALSARIDDDVPALLTGDAMRLRQVLVSLVGNAVKFTAEGSVTLAASIQPARREGEVGSLLRFDVADTGIGIPEEAMHRLFRSFSQVDDSSTRVYGGTGLGLAISRGLVEAMGGKIWVTSTPGEGSTFSFTVVVHPVSSPEPEPAPERASEPVADAVRVPAQRPSGAGDGLRVLLAEDNAVNQKVARMMLAKLGHTDVTVADNGALALAAAHEHDYDLVLMDIHMPEMDGLEATRRIRAELPADRQPHIVAVTASVTQEDRDACAAAGMDGYVPKPIKIDELAAAVARTPARAGSTS